MIYHYDHMINQFLALAPYAFNKPATDELNFNFNKYAKHIVDFIICEKIPSTFSIGINGEWGDGKTTLLNMIKTLLEKNNMTVIKFDAWKYEKINVVAALYQEIEQKLKKNHDTKKIAATIGVIIADEALRKYSGISIIGIKEKYKKLTEAIEIIPTQISDLIGDDKLLIWISLILHHTYLARKIILTPSYLIQASAICSDQEYLSNLKKSLKIQINYLIIIVIALHHYLRY